MIITFHRISRNIVSSVRDNLALLWHTQETMSEEDRIHLDALSEEDLNYIANNEKVPVRYRPDAASGGWGYGRDLCLP